MKRLIGIIVTAVFLFSFVIVPIASAQVEAGGAAAATGAAAGTAVTAGITTGTIIAATVAVAAVIAAIVAITEDEVTTTHHH